MKPFQNGTSFEPSETELRAIEARAKQRRKRMRCESNSPDCSAETFDAVRYDIRAAMIKDVPQGSLMHVRFRDGELYHSFIEKEALVEASHQPADLMQSDWRDDVEEEVSHHIASGYTLTAYGWSGTAGCKIAIIDEREAEAACPFCKGEIVEEEANGEGQQC